MLFTSWRNEETDLIGAFSSYQQRYMLLFNAVEKQMNQYAICNEDFNDIQQEMNTLDKSYMYDTIAPCSQNIEDHDETEGDTDLHPDFNENYNLSDDIGIPSVDSNTTPLILNEMQDDEYRCMVQMLNREQKEFFYHVLHLTKTSDEPFYCFLSGGAGVGKSHLTKALYQAALKYYNTRAGENFAEVNVLMLAPTGKAAYNIKGNTIHSALAIPACQSLKNYKSLDSSRLNTLRCQIGGVKLIFLDEISMVGNTMFTVQIDNRLKDVKGSALPFGGVSIIAIGDLFQLQPVAKLIFLDEISMVGNTMFTVQIDNRLKDVKGSALPFGGVSIIAIGDLFQLQPVMDSYIFKDMDNSEYSILTQNLRQEHFQMFELQEITRQRESKEFADMLNRLREGKHSKEDIIKFKERLIQSNNRNYPVDAPHLFIQNAKVNEFNDRAHRAISSTKYSIKAHDSVIVAQSQELRDKILKQIPSDPRKTRQLHSILNLATGERTEISLNTRTDDGMTNGAGNVIKLIQIHHTNRPSGIVWVQFDHAHVGEKT